MLVADALDAVSAKAVVEDGGALERLADGELQIRILLLEVVARAHGACASGGEARARKAVIFTFDRFKSVL